MKLTKKSKQIIEKKIKSNPLEDWQAVKTIENFFIKKRGYIFKMPKAHTPVILLLSGGLDSIVLWDILLRKYKLIVYPLFVTDKNKITRQLDHQYRSAKYFEKYYQKIHQSNNKIVTIKIDNSIQQRAIKQLAKNPKLILKLLSNYGDMQYEFYATTSRLSNIALDYIQYLRTKDIKINTIFTGNLATDGTVIHHQTLTSLRSNMFNLCNTHCNYNLQFTAPLMEKELRFFFTKNTVIKWAKEHQLPAHKTWSCYRRNNLIQCGTCLSCWNRKRLVKKHQLKDTLYQDDILNSILQLKTKVVKLVKSIIYP